MGYDFKKRALHGLKMKCFQNKIIKTFYYFLFLICYVLFLYVLMYLLMLKFYI